MGFEFFLALIPQLLPGVLITIEVSVIVFFIGNVLALGVALARVSKNPVIWVPAHGYMQLFRSTPFLVQLYLIYYGCGDIFAHTPAIRHSIFWPILREGFWYGVFALSLNTAAYSGYVFRGAIEAVPFGEVEAGRAFGMSKLLILRRVILPRALRICLPTMSGETISLVKTTATLSTVTVLDLLGTANFIRAQTFRVYEPLLAAAAYYIVLSFILTRGFRFMERYLNKDRLEPIQIKLPLAIESH